MLTAAYHILRDGVPFVDLGHAHFDRHDKTFNRLVRRLQGLGYTVEVQPHAA